MCYGKCCWGIFRRPYIRLKYKSSEEKNELIKQNPLFGKIICRCEEVSEGEIIDAIHRNCGATTVKGLKKRLRTGFGKSVLVKR